LDVPRSLSSFFVVALTILPACESAEDIGEHAGLEYIGPFIGVAEAQTQGCDSQLEVAKHMLDLGATQRAELKPKVEKVKNDEAFKKALLGLTDKTNGSTLQRFAADCPTQAAEFAKIAKQTAEELAIADLVPAWPPKG
jgi:hypothetical protein